MIGVSVEYLFLMISKYNITDNMLTGGNHNHRSGPCTRECEKGAFDVISDKMWSRGKKCALIDEAPKEHTGRAHFFVSHTWRLKFCEVAAAIHEEVKRRGWEDSKTFVWMDMLCLNQFINYTFTSDFLFDTFRSHIRNMQGLLLVASRELIFWRNEKNNGIIKMLIPHFFF